MKIIKLKDFFKRNKKEKANADSPSEENIKNINENKKKKFKKRYIPLIILIVLMISVVGARIYFNNERVKNLIENIVYSATDRKLEIGDFKYSLLSPNIRISDITLYNSENFNQAENISIDNLRLRFSLFSLFFLKLHIKEFSIDNLYLYMFTDESENWNIPDLPPSEPKITNKEPFNLSKLDFLKLKADIENIRINNLSVKADSLSHITNKPNNGLIASLSNFNLHLDAQTKRFAISKAASVYAPEILENIDIKSFISESLTYRDGKTLFEDNPLFNLNINNSDNKEEIAVKFDFEIDKPDFKYNEIKKEDMQASFNLLARYNINTQSLYIDNISSKLLNDEILKIIASATEIFGDNIGIDLDTLYAKIDLKKVNSLTSIFLPSLNLKMEGLISANAEKSSGTINDIENNLNISLEKINLSMPNLISINNLNSLTKINYDFNKNVSSKDDIKVEHKTTIDRVFAINKHMLNKTDLSLRVLSSLNGLLNIANAINNPSEKSDTVLYADNISTKYINSDIVMKGEVKFDEPTDLNINIKSLPLVNLSGGIARGSLNADLNIFGDMINDIDASIDGTINNFSYNLSGEVSSAAKAKLKLLANADLLSQTIKVSELNLDLDNFLNLKSYIDLEGMGLKSGFVNMHTLRIAPYSMKRWLSPKFSELLDNMPFDDDVKLTSALGYNLSLEDTFASFTNYSTFYVSEKQYKLQDVFMQADADVNFGENLHASIRKFNLESPANSLKVKVNGYFTPVIKNSDLNYEIGLDTENLYLPFGVEIGGLLSLIGNLKNNIANGDFITDKFFVNMDSPDKMSIALKGLKSDIDYRFDLTPTTNQSVSTAARYTPLVSRIPNLSFEQLRVYLKIAPFIDDSIRITDFSSAVQVQGHGLTIQDLKSSLYIGGEKFDNDLFLQSISNGTAPRRGAIHLPWLNVDLGSFNASSIKYDMRMLASDINFKYLLSPENRSKINDDKLLVNLTGDISGIGINPLSSVKPATFFVGISKMSTEFSKFLIEMIRPINPGISTVENIVQFGYDPNSVEFSISANKVFTTFYFRDQNLDKASQQKQQLIAFEGDKFGLEPMPFSDVISYLEGNN